jgi:hypothetical protein
MFETRSENGLAGNIFPAIKTMRSMGKTSSRKLSKKFDIDELPSCDFQAVAGSADARACSH